MAAKSGKERQNYQLFLIDLTRALGLPEPAPANDDDRDNPYIFERDVVFQRGRGETSLGRIDLYRRGAFVCEAKKIKPAASKPSPSPHSPAQSWPAASNPTKP